MAPNRSSRSSRLAARTNQDDSILSGYPSRHWIKEESSISQVAPKTTKNAVIKPDSKWHEPPMPRGSEMYAPHAQEILRRRRMPTVPVEDLITPDEDDENAGGDEDKTLHIPKYTLVPLGRESPGPKYLADRRKGLPSLYEGAGPIQTKRKAKVKQVLADGTEHIIEVLVPEGQTIPGEISVAVAPEVPAETLPAGTVVEGVGVANSEGVVVAAAEATTPQSNRRKPPPPKKRKVHPLKGRKKKVMLEVPNADGTVELVESAASGGTPRPDEDDGDDDDDGEEGQDDEEGTGEEGSPTPGHLDTPGTFIDPPRSVPLGDLITPADGTQQTDTNMDTGAEPDEPAIDVKQEMLKPITDDMEVDLPVPAPIPTSRSTDDSNANAPLEPPQFSETAQPLPAPIAATEPADLPPPAPMPPPTALAPIEQLDESLQATEPAATSTTPLADILPPTAAAEPLPPTEAPVAAPVETPTSLPIPEPTMAMEVAEVKESEPISVPSAPVPDAPVPISAELVNSTEAEAPTVTKPINDHSFEPAPDAIPDALKPEEIALSNPTKAEAEKLAEKVEGQPDILGSLEKSLG